MRFFFVAVVLLTNVSAWAQVRGKSKPSADKPMFTWDIGAAVGSYGGSSYTELDFAMNYRFMNYLNWRNVLYSRNGAANVSGAGLDSSLRFEYFNQNEDKSFSYKLFAGPGVRISSTENTGVFGEAGAVIRAGGLNVGAGVKVLNYSSPGKDPVTHVQYPNQDITYMIYLSGGG